MAMFVYKQLRGSVAYPFKRTGCTPCTLFNQEKKATTMKKAQGLGMQNVGISSMPLGGKKA